jgi:hypothetical protein
VLHDDKRSSVAEISESMHLQQMVAALATMTQHSTMAFHDSVMRRPRQPRALCGWERGACLA